MNLAAHTCLPVATRGVRGRSWHLGDPGQGAAEHPMWDSAPQSIIRPRCPAPDALSPPKAPLPVTQREMLSLAVLEAWTLSA